MALPDASRLTLPDLQHREAPARLRLGTATGFTAGKQPGAPRAQSGEGPSLAVWGLSHVSKVILSIFLQLGGSPGRQRGEEVPGHFSPREVWQQRCEPGQRRGSCVTDAGLWQGAEEVLQQH